jgi:hypothetical protein
LALAETLLQCVLLLVFATAAGAEVVDRVAAAVGNHAITETEVRRQLALEALIDLRPPGAALDAGQRRAALDPLIDRELVQSEIEVANFPAAEEAEVLAEFADLQRQTFWNGLSFPGALKAYGLGERDVQEFLREKNSFLGFIDFRFKTGLLVPAEEIEAYYNNVYRPEFQKTNNAEPPLLDEVADQIAEVVRERLVEPLVSEWLSELRTRARLTIIEESTRAAQDAGE